MKSSRAVLVRIAAVGLCVAGLVVALVFTLRHTPELKPLSQSAYVWQEVWSPAVEQAIETASGHMDGLAVFAAELRIEQGELVAKRKRIGWPALARVARPVTLVFRADDKVMKLLATAAGRARLAGVLRGEIDALRAAGRAAGTAPAGVQLDFDCPTARLKDYRALLEDLARDGNRGDPLEFSITALPTWLASGEFRALVKAVDFFVLQVHWIKVPKTIDEPVKLIEPGRLDGWLTAADKAGVPFEIALPTYAYRLFFDPAGACIAMAQEGAPPALPAGTGARVVSAQPEQLAGIVARLQSRRPRHCRGIIWFRMPMAGDAFNWPWPTLAAVMAGRAPRVGFTAELRRPALADNPGLHEIWVRNTGEAPAPGRISLPVSIGHARLIARDAIGGWRWMPGARDLLAVTGPAGSAESFRLTLSGPAPPVGDPARQVAWLRLIPKSQDQTDTITVGTIEIHP